METQNGMSTQKQQRTNVIPRKSNSQVEAGYVSQANKKVDDMIAKIEAREKFQDRAEKLAGSKDWVRNHTFHELVEKVPHEPKLWSVDRYFPQAIGGPLVVEEPVMDYQRALCEKRRPLIEAMGMRYLVLLTDMDETQDNEELEKCGHHLQQQ